MRTQADNQHVVDPNKLSPQNLGLRRDEIHEARKLRDAERESPECPFYGCANLAFLIGPELKGPEHLRTPYRTFRDNDYGLGAPLT